MQISLGGWENFLINIFGVCAPASPPPKKNCLWLIVLSVLTHSMVTSIGRGITHWYYSSNTIMHIGHCRTISESATIFSLVCRSIQNGGRRQRARQNKNHGVCRRQETRRNCSFNFRKYPLWAKLEC